MIDFKVSSEWKTVFDSFTDESGVEINHMESYLPGAKGEPYKTLVDVYLGAMPEGETAEDQAFANYAATVGFEDDEEENPIVKFKFNGKNAWGFDAVTEEDFPMRFLAQEVSGGQLAIIVYCVREEEMIQSTFGFLERNLRFK